MGRRGAAGIRRIDAFSKTIQEAQIKTSIGGVLTIAALVLIGVLCSAEWSDYRRIVTHDSLVVDQTRGERLNIHFNISIPHVPCEMLSLDVMDVSGEFQRDISHDVIKTRLDSDGKQIMSYMSRTNEQAIEERQEAAPEGYCGPCYGARSDSECCNTCKDVRDAYSEKGWSIGDYDAFEQCKREHYKDKFKAQAKEGCMVAGTLHVNKVIGNFHFAPGRSFFNPATNQHIHDLGSYFDEAEAHDFSHEIHYLTLGRTNGVDELTEPLSGMANHENKRSMHYDYFLKCVSRSVIPMRGDRVDTHSYSVTAHSRDLGGRDEHNPNHVGAQGGIPGIFFAYDISPMRIIEKEARNRSFGEFITAIAAVLGGVVTLFAMLDRGVHHAVQRLKKE